VPVARVDEQTLTLEDIQSRSDTSRELSQAHIQQFVQRWLQEELLYREAVKRGIDHSEAIDRAVEDARRQLAINALLDEEVYHRSFAPADSEVHAYYQAHKSEFILTNSVALVSFALFKNRDAATEFRNAAVREHTWGPVLARHTSSLIARADSQCYMQTTLFPPELWRVASNASLKEPSFPISADNGYYVLVVWRFDKPGQPSNEQMNAAEIRNRLLIEKRRHVYDSLLIALRDRHSVQVFSTSTGSDSSTSRGQE